MFLLFKAVARSLCSTADTKLASQKYVQLPIASAAMSTRLEHYLGNQVLVSD
jgi:hypothetical protein